MRTWLSYLNLSDEYERRARFMPAVFSILPLVPVATALGAPLKEWLVLLVAGVGVWAVMAVGLSHVASAFGNRLQKKLWPRWPHDSPTNRWLHPDNKTMSVQQKKRVYEAAKVLVHLDIQQSVDLAEKDQVSAVINDAVMELRNLLWRAPEAERLRRHNVSYGYARNFAGLRPVWLTFAGASLLGCWAAHIWLEASMIWGLISLFVAGAGVVVALVLPSYVRRTAEHYAESFFASVKAFEAGKAKSQGSPKEIESGQAH